MNRVFKKVDISKLKKKRSADAPRVALIGGGSWATALIKILSENKVNIHWWLRDKEAVRYIKKNRFNPNYLTNVPINKHRVRVFSQLKNALKDVNYVILVIPAAFVENALEGLNQEDLAGKIIISAVKGIIPEKNLLVTELLEQKFLLKPESLAILSGPCHAEEVALSKQSYLTVGAFEAKVAEKVAALLEGSYIKTILSTDVYGIEYCAVMKNIIALACGIARGLNYGDNFQAVLVSSAMQEIRRFVQKIYPHERDFFDSVYLGDLLVTAYSQFSRNRTFGNMIGRGYTVQSAQVEMNMIAEGYYAVKCIYDINKNYQISMPITKATYKILYEKVSPALELSLLKDLIA
ncbi:MAG: NAD(P)H-dependent glycerol-3-phosphate dehydrogenase [Microscillaceae bacterium]|nr:NAD(P)H-dependent glycerol-3-phosphate dehydrogenase [Microscillaceae bacterium]